MGQRISGPRVHRPPAEGLFESESSEEDPEVQASKLHTTTYRVFYNNLTEPYEPTPEEAQEVLQALPLTQRVLGVTIYPTGHPTTTILYGDGSKRHSRAAGGMSHGTFRAASGVQRPHISPPKTMACAAGMDPVRHVLAEHRNGPPKWLCARVLIPFSPVTMPPPPPP